MKIAFALFVSLLLCAAASADVTVQWWHGVANEELEVATIGGTKLTLRPIAPPKEKDPPRVALFIGDQQATKTPVYPGKRYHFAVVSKDRKTQSFLNGYPDGPPLDLKLGGDSSGPNVGDATSITSKPHSDAEILKRFKQDLRNNARESVTTVGHRGVHMHAPENTKISYVQAIEAKTPIVEFDTALTSDGHIIGMHDKTVDRTTDGAGKVAELTLEQMRKLDAGSWKHAKYKGEPVPTIDDIAEVCRGKAILMLDLKAEGQGKAIADWLEKSKFPRDQVILAPWEDAEGADLRKYVADVPMIRLTSKIPTETIDDAYFAGMKQIGFSGFSVNWQNLSKEFIDAAQKNGMKVYAWTLNDPIDIAGAVMNGVDGIITDDPAATMKLISNLSER